MRFAGRSYFGRMEGLAMRVCSFAGLLLAAQAALAQNTILDPVKVQRLPPAVKYSTLSAWPQIQPPLPPRPKVSENPLTPPWKNTGTPNNLPVGGMMNEQRGEAKIRFSGPGFTGYAPPDCDMSAGPNHIVAVVNTTIAFFTKDGTKQFSEDYGQFFKGLGIQGEIISDPKIFFDTVSKRWFTCILEVGFSSSIGKVLVGVSDDDNPNGNWFQYRIDDVVDQGGTKYWLDYPGFGTNRDTLVITGNMFGFSNGFTGNQYMVIPKAPLLTGGSPTVTSFVDPNASTMKVAVSTDGNIDKVYCIGDYNTSQIQLAAITGGASGKPTVTSTLLTVPSLKYHASFLQTPNGQAIDCLDGRIYNAAYRNGFLVGAHPINAPNGNQAICRWYQVKTNNWPSGSGQPTLHMSGNVSGPNGVDFSMPAININSRNAVAMVFTRSSTSIQADLMMASRKAIDPPGAMGIPQQIATSAGNNYSFYRWGDYFAVSPDPVDASTFWGFGMTVDASNAWNTWVASWKVVDTDSANTYFGSAPTVTQGVYQKGSADSLRTVDSNTYDVRTVPITGLGQTATWETTVKTDLNPTTADYLAVKWNATGSSAATHIVFAYNLSTKQYDSLTTKPLKSGASETFEIPATLFKTYLAADGTIKLAVRTVQPVRKNAMPAPFSYKVDMFNVLGLKKLE